MEQGTAIADNDFRAAAARLRDRVRAYREGWKDGRRGLPMLPVALGDDGDVRPPAVAGYQQTLHARAAEVSERYVAKALGDHSGLVEEIMQRATDVVFRYDDGTLGKVHLGRLQSTLGRWANAVQPYRAGAATGVAQAGQLLGHYWSAVLRRHVQLRRIRRGRAEVPVVTGADGETRPMDLSRWKPAPIPLDPRWDHPEEFLIRMPDIQPGQPEAYRYGPLARALAILRFLPEPGSS